MISLSLKHNFTLLETTMMALARDLPTKAARIALTRTVTQARKDVMAELPKAFHEPVPFTVNSVRYQMSTREIPDATVFISDDGTRGLSPRKYLQPEFEGGARGLKRSEKALIAKGAMEAGQRLMPGRGMTLDRYGNIPSSALIPLLSKLSAFGEQGYRANASEATRKRLERRRRAVRSTRTDVFVGHSKRGGEPLGVYQLVAKGRVIPVLAFANKVPNYKPRFDFHGIVEKSAQAHWPAEMMKAMQALLPSAR